MDYKNVNMITILFPSEYMNINIVDSNFELEYNACISLNMSVSLFDHDLFVSENKLKINNSGGYYLLRSWMLKEEQYIFLSKKINLVISPEKYIYAHHFPNIYEDIKKYAVNVIDSFDLSNINNDLIKSVQEKIKTDIIIKDYVKSEKGTDLFIINKNDAKTDLKNIIDKFVEQRYPLFNKGILFKPVVKLKRYGDVFNEWRVFYYKGDLLSLDLNTEHNFNQPKPNMGFIVEVGLSQKQSDFLTIDYAELDDGSWVVLEAGDGQVSGLTPFVNELEFYSNLLYILNKYENI